VPFFFLSCPLSQFCGPPLPRTVAQLVDGRARAPRHAAPSRHGRRAAVAPAVHRPSPVGRRGGPRSRGTPPTAGGGAAGAPCLRHPRRRSAAAPPPPLAAAGAAAAAGAGTAAAPPGDPGPIGGRRPPGGPAPPGPPPARRRRPPGRPPPPPPPGPGGGGAPPPPSGGGGGGRSGGGDGGSATGRRGHHRRPPAARPPRRWGRLAGAAAPAAAAGRRAAGAGGEVGGRLSLTTRTFRAQGLPMGLTTKETFCLVCQEHVGAWCRYAKRHDMDSGLVDCFACSLMDHASQNRLTTQLPVFQPSVERQRCRVFPTPCLS